MDLQKLFSGQKVRPKAEILDDIVAECSEYVLDQWEFVDIPRMRAHFATLQRLLAELAMVNL